MIRVILFLVLVGLAALGVNWLADRPGDVAITWSGWKIETSVMVMIIAVVVTAILLTLLWSLLRAIWRSPRDVMRVWHRRRGRLGYHAISRGLIAIGAGDARAAKRYARDAQKFAPREPLALLLQAQAAQVAGDRFAAERSFRAMAVREDTKLIGLRGLFIEAQRRNDAQAARLYAEEAARTAPALPWAGQAVLQFRCAARDWDGALDILARNWRTGALDRQSYRRQRAVLMTAQARALEETDRDRARLLAFEAAKLAPDLVPAVALAARFLAEAGEQRKASRMIERAWQTQPHPDLAEAYANVRLADSARERLARVRGLADMTPGHVEGALAVAAAAIGAREFVVAREALAPLLDRPTQRVALLMARIEELDTGDEGRTREWMRRAVTAERDPTWTADGFVSDQWLPMSPVSGRLDAFAWKVPFAEIEGKVAPVESAAPVVAEVAARPELTQTLSADEAAAEPEPEPVLPAAAMSAAPETMPAKTSPAPVSPQRAAPILPVIQVPDDPGPEAEPEAEPAPESPLNPRWRRLFGPQ